MTYNATWTNGNAQGRLEGGLHRPRLCDGQELASAINRRRLLTYQAQQDFSSHLYSGAIVKGSTVSDASYPPFDNFRDAVIDHILYPPTGTMGGDPPTPASMHWLWAGAGDDQNKIIVDGLSPPGPGEVGLLLKLNGGGQWTDPVLTSGRSDIRAVHFNELRQCIEWLRRGRWILPIYWGSGLFSVLPDAPWLPGAVANNGTDELRNVGYAVFRGSGSPPLGLTGLTALGGSHVDLTADADCTLELFHCLRPMDFDNWPATWNSYNPGSGGSWSAAGGLGPLDSVPIGAVALSAGVPGSVSGGDLLIAIQAIAAGEEQNFLIRRADTGYETVSVSAVLTAEFELNSPPN